MGHRIVEVIIPKGEGSGVAEWLADSVIDVWPIRLADERTHLKILIHADDTESLLDRLSKRFGHLKGFSAAVVRVDVALGIDADSSEQVDDDPAPGQGKSVSQRWLGRTVSRQQLLDSMNRETRVSGQYLATILLSIVVAAVGLVNSNVAVLIAAMIIAPLLGANVALALATTTADGRLAMRALTVNATGVATVLAISITLGWLMPAQWLYCSQEIMARTRAGLSDFPLALAAGAAGTLAFTTGLPGTLIGVMVAVALMPPLLVVGLMLGQGDFLLAWGAFILLAANVICLNLASVVTFLLQGVTPALWWQKSKARSTTRLAIFVWLVLLIVLAAIVVRVYSRAPPQVGNGEVSASLSAAETQLASCR